MTIRDLGLGMVAVEDGYQSFRISALNAMPRTSRLPALQQDVDGERSPVSYRSLLEAVDDALGVVDVFSDFRFVPTTFRIVVGHVALALHVDEQDGEGSDLRWEFPDGRLGALRAGVSML